MLLEDDVARVIQNLQREAIEPPAEVALRAVVDRNGIDGVLGSQIDLPPWILSVFLGVCLAAGPKAAVLVAVDGAMGVAAVTGVFLCRLPLEGDISAAAEYLYLREGQRPAPRQLDTHVPPVACF